MDILSAGTAKQDRRFLCFFSFGTFLFYAFLMWCTPYSSDDLEFAYLGFSTVGEYIQFALSYGNGRLLGNLCAFLLCNSKLICVLVKAFTLTTAVTLAPLALGLRSKSTRLLSFLLVTAMSPSVFGEAVIWTSGFGNYVPPILLTLLIVLLIQGYTDAKTPVKALTWGAVPVLGVASQLFIEHSSGVNGLLAFSFLVYYLYKKDRRKAVLSSIWLLATAIGLGLMFIIPKLFYQAGNRVETYRTTHLQSIATIVISCVKSAIRLLSYYYGVNGIPLCFGAVVTVLKTRHKRAEAPNRLLLALVSLAALYLILGMLVTVDIYFGKAAVVQQVLASCCVLLLFGVWFFAALKLDSDRRLSQLFLLSFAAISIAPLLVVSPTPPRVLLQSYVFIILAALQCLEWSGLGQKKYTNKILQATILSLMLLLGSVFFSIHGMTVSRDAHIQQEISNGATEVEVFILPYQYTTWDHLWSFGYPYEGGGDVHFTQVDFHTWMNMYY